jgi:hypothetical protein
MNVDLQPETKAQLTRVTPGTVAWQSQNVGIAGGEPLLVILDGLLRYAKAHRSRFDSPLAQDYVLGPLFLQSLTGIRGLLNGDGAVAHERGLSGDSKDNGVCEAIFWDAMDAAGYTEEDL